MKDMTKASRNLLEKPEEVPRWWCKGNIKFDLKVRGCQVF
jgi:hypothetical protein